MAKWSDIARWVGPTPNEGPNMHSHRGMVVHIAQGHYKGTISWQKNPNAQTSSHFIVAKDGRISQMVDTARQSWCQVDGNADWMSIENEGFTPGALTDAQLHANAVLLARGHLERGFPLQVATSPSGKGLGHHSMGAPSWGHSECPGPNIIAQKAEIVARAQSIVNGEDDMYEQKDRDWLYQTREYVEALYENRESAVFTLDGVAKDVPNWVGTMLEGIQREQSDQGAKIDQILAALAAGTVPGGPVNLTPEAIAQVVDGVNDEAATRLET